VSCGLVAIALLLLSLWLTQAEAGPAHEKYRYIDEVTIDRYYKQQGNINNSIKTIEKQCEVHGDKYTFSVDETSNLRIMKADDNETLTIDRSRALTSNNFFEDNSVRDLIDSQTRDCIKSQWIAVMKTADPIIPNVILPSRMFAGPSDYPPRNFKAYGIIAFNSLPVGEDRVRYTMICEAYVSSLVHFTQVDAPFEKQMVTVWPLESKWAAVRVNAEEREQVCADAVPHYGLSIAQTAIAAATAGNWKIGLTGRGPFLLAWSPGAAEGQKDALVLKLDMSDVINGEQAMQIMKMWKTSITEKPQLWEHGWDQAGLTLTVRLWADKWGSKLLQLISSKP
jgi:hypothetical protein